MKGQLFSIDFMVAVFIFLVTLSLVIYFGLVIPRGSNQEIQARANSVADYLVTEKLGSQNILECYKVVNFASKNYDEIKNETGSNPYDIWVEFKNSSVICDGNQTNFGDQPSTTTIISSIIRIIYLDDKKMQMIVRLYD